MSSDNGAAPWYVDHLFVDQEAIPTLVEVKRSSDPRIRREVIGQMLDYAANAVTRWSSDELRARFMAEPDAVERLQAFLGGADPAEFWKNVGLNLAGGRIRMVFVADVIPPELRRVVDFLAAQLKAAEVFAVEVRNYGGPKARALVPRLVSTPKSSRTEIAERKWDEKSFLAALEELELGSTRACVARAFIGWAREHALETSFGKGATAGSCTFKLAWGSLRIPLFAMWTYGVVEMQFQHLNCAPFERGDSRSELLHRLNRIEGLSIPEDAISRRPTFDILLLSGDAVREQFQSTIEWAIERIRSAAING